MPSLSRQLFFPPDFAQGSLRRTHGSRVVALSLNFIRALHAATMEHFGSSAPDMLYRSGYEWGLQEMLQLNQKLQSEIGGSNLDLWQMDGKFILESWWTPLAEAGWGRCAFDLSALARGRISVELHGSIIAAAASPTTEPACHLYAGLFAGALSFYERAERHAAELQCSGHGHAACRFLVGPGAEIDSAEAWRKQGTSAVDITRRLG